MTDFFRFPHTPHLAWLGPASPRDDKVLSPAEASELLSGAVVVEEKLDGANLGISFSADANIQFQNRGQFVAQPYSGQFSRLASWAAPREEALLDCLGADLILFGEWCTARHSLDYPDLPDWFVAFDVYDRREERFWSTARRNALADRLQVTPVRTHYAGKTSLETLRNLVLHTNSHYRTGTLEGIVVRRENPDWLEARAKLVHPDFTQAITEHWSRRAIEWNRLGV